jgi:hypothetical protein
MEVLRFDSRFPNSKYAGWVADLALVMQETPVICRGGATAAFGGIWSLIPAPECTFETILPLLAPKAA